MLVQAFKTNRIYIFAFIPLVLMALRFPGLQSNASMAFEGSLPWVADLLSTIFAFPVLQFVLGILLITWQGIVLSSICDEHRLLGQTSNLPAFILAILLSLHWSLYWLSPALIASVFITYTWKAVAQIYNQSSISMLLFKTGIFIGLASSFYRPSMLMFPVLFYSLSIFRKFDWREYAIPITGWAAVVFYNLFYFMIQDTTDSFLSTLVKGSHYFDPAMENVGEWTTIAYTSLWFVLALISLIATDHMRTVRINNIYKVLMALPILAIPSVFIWKVDILQLMIICAAPVAIVLSNFLLRIRRVWLAESLVYIWIALILFMEYQFIS